MLDGELKRALEVLAATHDSQKKLVSLNFKGDGKRCLILTVSAIIHVGPGIDE